MWYENDMNKGFSCMELDMIMKHEWVIFNVIGHPMYPGVNPDPGTFNKSLIPPNFSNQRLKFFETGVRGSLIKNDYFLACEIDVFEINFKFTRRKTIKCGCFTMFDNNQGFTTSWTNWWFVFGTWLSVDDYRLNEYSFV